MTTYRPIDSKREEFRKYLERAGVMDALTKALVSLYEEANKPEDALDYVRKHLGDNRPDVAEFEALQTQLAIANEKQTELLEEIDLLKAKVASLEPPTEEQLQGQQDERQSEGNEPASHN